MFYFNTSLNTVGNKNRTNLDEDEGHSHLLLDTIRTREMLFNIIKWCSTMNLRAPTNQCYKTYRQLVNYETWQL